MGNTVETVRGFRRLRALVIGDAMLDTYLEGTAARLCSEGPVPVVRKTVEDHRPGGAANTAANVRALGAEVMFLGVVGEDTAGELLRSVLRQEGVDDSYLVSDPQVDTLHKIRILANDQYVVRFDSGEMRYSDVTRARLRDQLKRLLPLSDLVIASDYGYDVLSDGLIAELRLLRVHHPRPLAVDSKDLRRFRRAAATVVTPNHLEARLVVEGAAWDGAVDVREVERIGRGLLRLIDAEQAAVTMAAQGVLLIDRINRPAHLPAHPVPQANDVGAGDSFTSAMALALAAGAGSIDAVRIGIEAAGIAVTRPRTAAVRHQELLQRVSLRSAAPPSLRTLLDRLAEERRRGRRVVFTNGVFDILHAGHVSFLREAKSLGDILVVGVNSDNSARQLKGKNRPINSERDRLALVAALDPVDHVIAFDESTPEQLIRSIRPDVHVKGGDYAGQELPEAGAVEEVGARLVILPLAGDHSTSGVIDRILAMAVDGRPAGSKQVSA